jgi:hypothetical protein
MELTKEDKPRRIRWFVLCCFTILPTAAILHHTLFYRPTCMLNPFGPDYNIPTLWHWLSRDPSLPYTIIFSLIIYWVYTKLHWVKIFVLPYVLSFLPLSVWVWDIPFTGRTICKHFHDDRLVLLGTLIHTRHLYVLGVFLFVLQTVFILIKHRKYQSN